MGVEARLARGRAIVCGPLLLVAASWAMVSAENPCLAAFTPIGSEFQVNTSTPADQGRPAIAPGAENGFVVVWQSAPVQGQGDAGISGRRFDSSGSPIGSEFLVNSSAGSQNSPALGSDDGGGFVVAWDSPGQDGDGDGIFARRFDSSGSPIGSEFQINTTAAGSQSAPSIARAATGEFVVVWQSQEQLVTEVAGQRYNSSGSPLGGEFQISTIGDTAERPSVSIGAGGDFVVVWERTPPMPDPPSDVVGRRYDSSGQALGGEFQVSAVDGQLHGDASVAVESGESFVVAWRTGVSGGPAGTSISGRRYDSVGGPVGSEFQINAPGTSGGDLPAVAADPAGGFVVAWKDDGAAVGDPGDVFAHRYDSAGRQIGSEFQVATSTAGEQNAAGVTTRPAIGFTAVWQSPDPESGGNGVIGQAFGRDLDDDGTPDQLDTDDDGDLVEDVDDCRPFDPELWRPPSGLPPTLRLDQTQGPMGVATSLTWDPPFDSGGSQPPTYKVYRGDAAQLPNLLLDRDPGGVTLTDSCLRWVETNGAGASPPFVTENPPPGELYWFLVRPQNPCGQGGAGRATAGDRVQFASDSCSACAHDVCATGAPGTPLDATCAPCVPFVCDADPDCCGVDWDARCVDAVAQTCGSLACGEGQGACSHGLCQTGQPLAPGCDAVDCVAAVCTIEPSCCSNAWDARCTLAVELTCGFNCY